MNESLPLVKKKTRIGIIIFRIWITRWFSPLIIIGRSWSSWFFPLIIIGRSRGRWFLIIIRGWIWIICCWVSFFFPRRLTPINGFRWFRIWIISSCCRRRRITLTIGIFTRWRTWTWTWKILQASNLSDHMLILIN